MRSIGRQGKTSCEFPEAAADRTARTKMMATLFHRVFTIAIAIIRGAHRSARVLARYASRGRGESFVFRAEFSPRATDRERETNDAEETERRKKGPPLNATTVGVDARRGKRHANRIIPTRGALGRRIHLFVVNYERARLVHSCALR